MKEIIANRPNAAWSPRSSPRNGVSMAANSHADDEEVIVVNIVRALETQKDETRQCLSEEHEDEQL